METDSALVSMQEVGVAYGYGRETTDWVSAVTEPLAATGGRLAAGSHRVALRLPSWSPGSSSVVRWEARLHIQHAGRGIDATATFRVLVAPPSPEPTNQPVIQGEGISHSCDFDIVTECGAYRPGEEVRGLVRITPHEPVDRRAELTMRFTRFQESHPLERTPGATDETNTWPETKVASGLTLTQGVTTDIPFAVALPGDADPTTEAVHCSVTWCIAVLLTFAGLTGGVEQARREIVVYTA